MLYDTPINVHGALIHLHPDSFLACVLFLQSFEEVKDDTQVQRSRENDSANIKSPAHKFLKVADRQQCPLFFQRAAVGMSGPLDTPSSVFGKVVYISGRGQNEKRYGNQELQSSTKVASTTCCERQEIRSTLKNSCTAYHIRARDTKKGVVASSLTWTCAQGRHFGFACLTNL